MLLQIVNIITGALLAAPKLKSLGGGSAIDKFESFFATFRAEVGIAEFVLGIVTLLMRMDILPFYIGDIGVSYPQAFSLIAIGLLLGATFLSRYTFLSSTIKCLERYRTLIGVLGIAVGLGSLLFGCPWPLVCGQLFR